jgi:two-component system osmolarity sensor histidine kinase EnvZ
MRLKKFIPQSLYGRFLLIIVVPILFIQLVSIYVFYYTHLDVISKHMARNVIAEMVFVKKSVNNPEYEKLLRNFSRNVDLEFSFQENRRLKKKSKIGDSDWRKSKIYNYINPLVDPYNRFKSELKLQHLTPYEIYENPESDDTIIVKVQTDQGIISFYVPIKRITSSSAYVFTFWIILTAIITALISIIFLKNQIRSIHDLSKSAEKFGRGQEVANIRPKGSKEIRSLAISFIKMKERVKRQITQRTDMLSAVSHDLRTPLTRMKLQLELMPNSEEKEDLKQDINDMERLVEEYLDFARSDEKEKAQPVKIKNFLREKIINYYGKMNKKIGNFIELPDDLTAPIKQVAFKRALMNLVDNAFNYGSEVNFYATISNNNLMITIDDNGPGIPTHERANVFKPFYRIDNSRNLDKKTNHKPSSGGSGLGLAISMDAITSHGGHIKLSDSPMKGLRVLIYIPI